jgi:hypothetical protein
VTVEGDDALAARLVAAEGGGGATRHGRPRVGETR